MKKVIEGMMFIIPNSPARISSLLSRREELLKHFEDEAAQAYETYHEHSDAEAEAKAKAKAESIAMKAIISYKLAEYQEEKADSVRKEMKKFFGDVKDDEELIQIWVYGSGSENWSCHGWPGQVHKDKKWSEITDAEFEERQSDQFPSTIPVQFLKGVKEGDMVEFEMADGRVLRLTANQLENRYAFGPFEKVLNKLLLRCKE